MKIGRRANLHGWLDLRIMEYANGRLHPSIVAIRPGRARLFSFCVQIPGGSNRAKFFVPLPSNTVGLPIETPK
jgi:hypothetical protein